MANAGLSALPSEGQQSSAGQSAFQFIGPSGQLTQPLPKNLTAEQLIDFYKAMVLTRSFDKKCIALQRTGQMGTYPSCLGQEAVGVGLAKAMLDSDVFIPYYRDQATQLIRGVSMCEIMQYWGGDERGSDYLQCPEDLPNCVPIATQCSHAVGIASALKLRHELRNERHDESHRAAYAGGRAALCTLGDGASAKGDFLESLNAASVWELPLVFVINNNQWAISTPTHLEHKLSQLSDLAAGAGLPGVQVDGNDVTAVYHVVQQALQRARAGKGPTLIEAVSYRLGDHTTADDASRYRDTDEVKRAWGREPIKRLQQYLHSQQLWQAGAESQLLNTCQQQIESAVQVYLNLPPQPPEAMFDYLYETLPAPLHRQRQQLLQRFPSPSIVKNSTVKNSSVSHCTASNNVVNNSTANHSPVCPALPQPKQHQGYPAADKPTADKITLIESITLALRHEMQRNPDMLLLGEDIGRNGGVFRATAGLQQEFGPHRVIDTPLAETLIAGVAVGMACQHLKPVLEIQFMGFIYPALDQLISHAARLRNRTRGRLSCPLVVRVPFGGGIHAPEHHSESTEAMLAHIPGLRLVIPSSPKRAYGLLLAALRSPDPVVFLEPKRIYRAVKHSVEDSGEALPLDRCFTLRVGQDLTLVTWGALVQEAQQAAKQLHTEGIEVEVIDVATLQPLDMDTIITSVTKTGRVLIAHEAVQSFGAGAEIAARLAEHALPQLKAPIKRLGGYDTIMPLLQNEHYYLLSSDDLAQAARALMQHD